MPKISRVALLALFAFAFAAFAGCGDDKKTNEKPKTPKISTEINLKVVGNGNDAKFDKKEVDAKAGTVKLTVSNPDGSGKKHGIGIDGGDYSNVEGVPVAPGRQTSLTITLKPGKYTFYDSAKEFKKDKDLQGTITVEKEK